MPMTDSEFLDYCETHAETERAGFMGEQIERLCCLAGVPLPASVPVVVDQEPGPTIFSFPQAGDLARKARERLASGHGSYRSPLDTLPEQDAARWRHVIEMCQSWPKTREQPHPPMRAVVEYVIPQGTRFWDAQRGDWLICANDFVLAHPPTHEAFPAVEQDRQGIWRPAHEVTRPKSVPYLIRVHDPELYAWLFAAGYLAPPPAPFVDNLPTS